MISWKSKKHATVALSTCEAEYMSMAAATQESQYLVQLLNSKDILCHTNSTIFEDNQGAIALAKNPCFKQQSKHI